MASAAYAFTFTRFPAYTGSIAGMDALLSRALSAIDANAGHAGPNTDAADYQRVISKFFFDNRVKLSGISVSRNGVFLGYVDASGYTSADPATVTPIKGATLAGNAATTLTLTSKEFVVYDTALTAARNVALPTASLFHSFTVTRTANATGSYDLTVKQGSTTLWTAAAAKAWAQFASDGTNWFLTAQGTLP